MFKENEHLSFLASSNAVSFVALLKLVSKTFLPSQHDDMMRADQCFAEWSAVYDRRPYSIYPYNGHPLPPRPYAVDMDDFDTFLPE